MENIQKISYQTYKRFCLTLTLKDDPALIKDYIKAHAPGKVWPEITKGMKDVGILNMEIYIFGTRLFMIMDTVPDFDHDQAMQKLNNQPRQSEWQAYVSKFQNTSPEATAEEKWQAMDRIYILDK